jgi:putative SOS response-associated peptidase YedK
VRRYEGLSRVSWKLSRTVLRGADGGNAARLLDKKLDAKTKQPYAIALKDRSLFAFAGLWDSWKDEATGQSLETYTVITTEPNELMETIHNRMPVILAPKNYERWLEPGEHSHLPVDLLKPYPAENMKAWKIKRDVGNVRNNRPELVEPIEDRLTPLNV